MLQFKQCLNIMYTSVQALCSYGLRVILQAANQTINSRQSSSLPCIKSSIQSPTVPARSHFDFGGRCNALRQVRVEIFVNCETSIVRFVLNKTNEANTCIPFTPVKFVSKGANKCLPLLPLPRLHVIYNTIAFKGDTLTFV